ncbi:MAG: peptidase U32 family protein [Eggerthellaceae bacterium]|jgi:putative protease
MELLAPAGGFEQLHAALHFGADAVYLGGDRFGLRVRADNFSGDALGKAIATAHAAGVKAYVTVNALIHPSETDALREHLRAVADAGADAVLISDLGALMIAKQETPGLPIHLSTQASVTNAQAARAYAQLGVRRIVLARELSLAEIAAIRAQIDPTIELEVFGHGSMCMAYSGRCLISNFLTGRDANRGNCTQPCRWSYALEEEQRPGEFFPIEEHNGRSFILSSADLMMLEHLDDLRAAGVDSLKIEGRVKTAYYVGTVVNAYRQVLDGRPAAEMLSEMDAVSHRPYSTGFFYGSPEQAYRGKEYSQTCDFIGMVERCDIQREGSYRIQTTLRNRFKATEPLEAVAPGRPVRGFRPLNIDDEDGIPVAEAMKTAQTYTFDAPFELDRGDILRKRRTQPGGNPKSR